MGMTKKKRPETLRDVLRAMSDSDLIKLLKYIRDENGEKVSLIELKHYLREEGK